MTDSTEKGAISSPLSLSDEEIASMSFEEMISKYDFDDAEESPVEEDEDDTESHEEGMSLEDSEESDESTEEGSEEEESTEDNKEEDEDSVEDIDNSKKDNQNSDYQELVSLKDKLFAPFKANGKELKIDTVEQAISLMQMGANYTQKMTQLKPLLKTHQMLEQHGLTKPEDLSYVIDLFKKDPKAIAKLLKDADLHPHQLGDEEADAYTGSDYSVTDTQFDFATVTGELRAADPATYSKLMQHVTGFDQKSKNALFENPEFLKDLNEHVLDGTYDKVMAEVDRRRMLGDQSLARMSSLDAYVTVGRALAEQAAKPATVVAKKTVAPKAKSNTAKAVASSVKTNGSPVDQSPPNFLSMSDDEFLAYTNSQKVLKR